MTTKMPTADEAQAVVDLLLQSAFNSRQDGRGVEFLFGRPGAPMSSYRLGSSIFFSSTGLAKAALQLRQCGPLYLRSVSIGEVENRLMDFLKENYWSLTDYVWAQLFSGSFATRVPPAVRDELVSRLLASQLLSPRDFTTVYPLVPIRVEQDFVADPFFLVAASSLTGTLVGSRDEVLSTSFPPIARWHGKYATPLSWLGIRSPAQSSAKRMRNVILGALALLPHPSERYLFSGRTMFGGSAAFVDGVTFSYGDACTPALMQDLPVAAGDVEWLEVLATKVDDSRLEIRRQMRALEYFYRAWPLSDVERFPVLFMALDAVFGNASQHTQGVVEAIGTHLGTGYDETRLKLLMKLRAAVIHGGAPDVYDSDHYGRYFENYKADPIRDFERIVARCLQVVIFEGKQTTRPHTHAELIKAKFGREP